MVRLLHCELDVMDLKHGSSLSIRSKAAYIWTSPDPAVAGACRFSSSATQNVDTSYWHETRHSPNINLNHEGKKTIIKLTPHLSFLNCMPVVPLCQPGSDLDILQMTCKSPSSLADTRGIFLAGDLTVDSQSLSQVAARLTIGSCQKPVSELFLSEFILWTLKSASNSWSALISVRCGGHFRTRVSVCRQCKFYRLV